MSTSVQEGAGSGAYPVVATDGVRVANPASMAYERATRLTLAAFAVTRLCQSQSRRLAFGATRMYMTLN